MIIAVVAGRKYVVWVLHNRKKGSHTASSMHPSALSQAASGGVGGVTAAPKSKVGSLLYLIIGFPTKIQVENIFVKANNPAKEAL